MALHDQLRLPTGALGHVAGWAMASFNRTLAYWGVRELRPGAGARVLELGSGPGIALELLALEVAGGQVFGIDPSRVMVRQATRRLRRAGCQHRVEVSEGRAEALPFADAMLDAALAIDSLPFWSDPQAGLRELHRTLRSGGRFVSVVRPRSLRTEREVLELASVQCRWLHAAGFDVQKPRLRSFGRAGAFALIAERRA